MENKLRMGGGWSWFQLLMVHLGLVIFCWQKQQQARSQSIVLLAWFLLGLSHLSWSSSKVPVAQQLLPKAQLCSKNFLGCVSRQEQMGQTS